MFSTILSRRPILLCLIDRIEPMSEPPRKRAWYFEDDLADRSAITYPHPSPVPAIRLKVSVRLGWG